MNRTLDRTEYIEKLWQRYPRSREGWIDVATFLERPLERARVCGRLSCDGRSWRLSTAGESLAITWSPGVEWMDRAEASPLDILRSGDLVCVALHSNNGSLIGEEVLLLAPSMGEYLARSGFDVARSKQWASFLAEVRGFFVSRGFIEAATPTLVPSPGTEPFLDPFATEWRLGSRTTRFYLPTSPEFHLKKMLALGWTKVFEIKPCFRNSEIGPHHQPEFWMLEWYRAYSDLDAIARDTEELVAEVARRLAPSIPVAAMKTTTMTEVFAQAFPGFVLRPDTTDRELRELATAKGVAVSPSDSWDDLFFRIFLEKIEAGLGTDGPLLVRGYPPSQAALSRIGPDGFADRFEVYWRGLELANAFHELNDPVENEARFRADSGKKAELGKEPVPTDEELLEALNFGMPPSGGIALGLDRLFMALLDVREISETRAFPMRELTRRRD